MRVNLIHDLLGASAGDELARFLAANGIDAARSSFPVYPTGDSLSARLFVWSEKYEATFVILGRDSRHRSWVLPELRVARSHRDTTLLGPGLIPVFYESGFEICEANGPTIQLADGSDWQLAVLALVRPLSASDAVPT